MSTIKSAVAALVLAASALSLSACGDVPLEEQPGYEKAHDEAGFYCTLAGVVGPNGPKSLYDPAYLNCVEEETKVRMDKD